jgi:hypothetical protein
MALKPIPPRLFGLLATNAKIAVLLRRGPSRWCQMILWHTDTDKIIPGQWVHHRIYEHSSCLSPDGQFFVYHAFGPHRSKNSKNPIDWLAISRPPYFTALTMWRYHLGELVFEGNATTTSRPRFDPSKLSSVVDTPLERLQKSGWKHVRVAAKGTYPHESVWEKPHRRSKSMLVMRSVIGLGNQKPGRGTQSEDYAIRRHGQDTPTPLENADWADIDQKQRLVFTREGRLYAAEILPDGLRESLLADFTTDQPTEIPPPAWAKKWPKS